MSEPNYITRRGVERIRAELNWLQRVERPKITAEVSYAASLGDRSENAEYIYGKKRLREIDGRIRYLIGRLSNLRIVDPGDMSGTTVRIGATVVLEDEEGREQTWRIYGRDEVDVEGGVLSYQSPLGRALLGKTEGDGVRFRTPRGMREVEVLEVRFEAQVLDDITWPPPKS